MNFKQWFEDTQLAMPNDPENNGLSMSSLYSPDEDIDPQTGRKIKLRSRKAEKMFGFGVNRKLRRE